MSEVVAAVTAGRVANLVCASSECADAAGLCTADDVSQSDNNSTVALSHPLSPKSCSGSSRSGVSVWSRSSTSSLAASFVNTISWDSLRFGHRIKPSFKYAHRINDVYILSCFLDLTQVPDISCDASKLLMRTLKMLRACDFSSEDICSVLAHASAYFEDAFSICGDSMDGIEVGNVMALLIFIAHSYVQDETCRLRIWHKYLFTKYCSLDMLNAAVVRLLEIRHYVLRVESGDLSRRYACLLKASSAEYRFRDSGSSPYSSSPSIAGSSPCNSTNAGVSASSVSTASRGGRSDGETSSSAVRTLDFSD